VVEITPISIKTIGYKTYIYFCVFNACFVPIIWWFYPETAKLSLEQIDLLFTGDKVLLHLPPVSEFQPSIWDVKLTCSTSEMLNLGMRWAGRNMDLCKRRAKKGSQRRTTKKSRLI
jgi:hypothetical protein